MDIVAVGGYDQGPFLRKNIVKGSYCNVEHYLDIQFRLLREDFLRPLREGIQLLMATPSDGKDDRLKDVRIYKNARNLDPIFTSKGVRYKIKFDVSEFRRLEWENSKRLTYGSLLCLSKDNFKTFVFASVAERMLQDVRRGVIQIRVVSPTSEERLKRGDVYQMVESIAFFEAYRPVLIGLQMMSSADFPFKRYIVHVKNDEDVSPPSYLRTDNKQVLYDFAPIMHSEAKEAITARSNPNLDEGNDQSNEEDSGPKAEVLDLASWPSASDLNLDDSQLKALQLALTKEFAIIQGPPGTGKTYVGLKIVQMLLHNRNVWSINETGGPILVVCYTNHALDQFLEGILEFHSDPCGIIRVGGRSQSEKLKDRCLSILKKEMIKNKRMPKALSCAFAEIKEEMNEIAALIVYHDKINEELKRRVFHEAELKEYASSMTSLQYDSLVKGSNHALTDTKESIIPEWLGLPVPPMDPYQDGFARPLAMFPLNAACQHLEYFSQEEMAIVSDVYPGPGPEGHPQGSLQLKDISDSFIVIPNLSGGLVDAEKSITLLAFIYPLRESRMMISYHPDGLGVQLACEFDDEIGKLTASFIQRDLMPAEMPITAKVLEYNEWNFVGASYDFETGMAILWHNGSVVKSANIGKGLFLATQFDIKISVTDSSSSENKFSVRVSHLHIYGEALTSENIQAIGAISHNLGNTMTSCTDKRATPEGDEEVDEEPSENDEDRGINTDQKWKSPSFKFDADVLEDQRILETDEVIKFNPRPGSDEPNTEATSSGTEMRAEWGSFQYQNARLMRKKIKDIIRKELKKDDVMTKEEAAQVENVWEIADTSDRWCLYRRWVHDACEGCHQTIFQFQEMFDEMADELQELRNQEDYEILKNADVVGMTTTGAAKNRSVLHDLKPVITIVEEAAEVFEAHTVTSLTPACQHVILIGDHQQLRPNPTVYDLQIKFALDVSLFERMVKNGIQFVRLGLQHRMRPEIATLLDHIYVEPRLRNHPSVLEFENVKGVERNLFFLDHTETEDHVKEGSSKSNLHEAKLLTALCRYLIQQGYEREQIAVLTAYSGQLLNVRREMSKDKDMFEGVRLTAVDSFQGEESDIILLSLVRSKRIGFLKIENRVCVALSRARKGFFIIGNAKLLEEQDTSGLWPKIISNLREQKSLGKHLKLICQIHSQNVIEASKAEDFENAPEGGCHEPCKYKMPDCEHRCPHLCHPVDTEHKERYACQMPCTRTCDSGHLCGKVCSEDCGPCMVKVPKLIPKCNHEQQVPCSVDPSEFNCKQLVQKQAFPCGHTSLAECSMAPTAIICTEPCGKLECGHLCEGNCNTCLQGRLHQPCRNPCERILPCGHECEDACVRPCPPCSKTCRICRQKCCYPCREFGGNKKECPHDKHDQCYDEPSKRQECQKRCQEQLSCGHSCIGICGDVCPRLCYVCNAEEFRNSEKDAMFVELTDCGHVFEVNRLDLWIAGSSGEGDEHEIKQKQCPKCETRILHSVRYEEIVSDLNAVKRQILLSQVVSRIQLQNLRGIVKNLKLTEMKEHVQKIESSLNNSTGLSFSLVSKCQNQVSFLKSLEKLYKVDNGNRTLDLHFLTARIMQERVCFSSQEIREFTQEITRTTLLVFLECIMTDLESRTCILSPDYERRVNSAKSVLASGKKIDHQEMELIFADLSKIKQRYSVHVLKDVKLTDSVSELLRDIVMTKHLAQEPWYKCSQGHVYSSADRNNEGDIKCPTCFAATAMTPKTHRQVLHGGKQLNQKNTMPHRFQLCRPARARQGWWQPFSRFRK
ncbi:NFX1-type zinc finger-containing protein 1-like isoform X4 [Montipora capricornis]